MITNNSKWDIVVAKFMKLYGFEADIVTEGVATYNPATSQYTKPTIIVKVKAILMERTLPFNGDMSDSGILFGDKILYVQPPVKSSLYTDVVLDELQANRDRVRINGDEFKIVTFKNTNPSTADSSLWECYIRK
jgi:hypothetical protein